MALLAGGIGDCGLIPRIRELGVVRLALPSGGITLMGRLSDHSSLSKDGVSILMGEFICLDHSFRRKACLDLCVLCSERRVAENANAKDKTAQPRIR